MNLSIRLQTIADMVPAGAKMADIGTDHGHLPICLVQSGKIRHAVAMDVGEGPLSRAQHAIRQCHLTKHIETRLSDGAAGLQPGEVDTIVIAGMGGALIQKIMGEGRHMWDSVSHWIISPQSEQGETRHWLEQNGFCIAGENMVLDGGKYYVIMDVIRGTMCYKYEYEYTYGSELIRSRHPVLQEYLMKEQEKMKELLSALEQKSGNRKDGISDARLHARIEELRDRYSQALAAWNAIQYSQLKADDTIH